MRSRRRSDLATILGAPVHILVIGVAASALIGALLSWALGVATDPRPSASSLGSVASGDGDVQASSGIPVVTEQTLGREVSRLVDSGADRAPANFDVTRCVEDLDAERRVSMMQPVVWGSEEQPAWMLVLSDQAQTDLLAEGGTVGVLLVTEQCGSQTPQEALLWRGEAAVGGA